MSILPMSAQMALKSVTLVGDAGAKRIVRVMLGGEADCQPVSWWELTGNAIKVRNTKNIDVAAQRGAGRADWQLALSEESWVSNDAGDEAAEGKDGAE